MASIVSRVLNTTAIHVGKSIKMDKVINSIFCKKLELKPNPRKGVSLRLNRKKTKKLLPNTSSRVQIAQAHENEPSSRRGEI